MTQAPGKRWIAVAALAVVLLAYSAVVAAYLAPRQSIGNLDFWYRLSLGQRLQLNEPSTLVDGMNPLGYTLFLRLATERGIDALRAGQILSWAGGFLALGALFVLVYFLTGSVVMSVAGSLLLLTNQHFLYHATYEGNDLLAAGLQAASLAALCYGIADDTSSRPKLWLVASSILLGLAYLTRYTALILLPVALFCVVLRYRRSPRKALGAFALYLLTFLVMTVFQWLPSWMVYDNPFYNTQAKNVWFGIYGQSDWVSNWDKVPDTIRLKEVIALDPDRFIRHWLAQIRSALATTQLWPWPFQLGWIVALPSLLLARRPRMSVRLLLVLATVIPLVATALAWLTPRFLLLSLWAQAVLLSWLAFHLARLLPLPKSKKAQLAIATGVLVIPAMLLQWQSAREWWGLKPLDHPPKINAFLRVAGMQEAARVATNDPYLHATDEPSRTRYAQTYSVHSSPATVEELLAEPGAAGWQYLVMDYSQGFGNYSGLREAFRQAKNHLAPLALSDRRDIFCVLPCGFPDATPISLSFGDMHLVGYRLRGTQREGALYLYWQAEGVMDASYKVSVRIMDATGTIVLQQDNVPEQWTWSTTQWRPGELVVDFYSWQLDQECHDCQVSLLVYDENTLEPLTATTSTGETVGPLIGLVPLPR